MKSVHAFGILLLATVFAAASASKSRSGTGTRAFATVFDYYPDRMRVPSGIDSAKRKAKKIVELAERDDKVTNERFRTIRHLAEYFEKASEDLKLKTLRQATRNRRERRKRGLTTAYSPKVAPPSYERILRSSSKRSGSRLGDRRLKRLDKDLWDEEDRRMFTGVSRKIKNEYSALYRKNRAREISRSKRGLGSGWSISQVDGGISWTSPSPSYGGIPSVSPVVPLPSAPGAKAPTAPPAPPAAPPVYVKIPEDSAASSLFARAQSFSVLLAAVSVAAWAFA